MVEWMGVGVGCCLGLAMLWLVQQDSFRLSFQSQPFVKASTRSVLLLDSPDPLSSHL